MRKILAAWLESNRRRLDIIGRFFGINLDFQRVTIQLVGWNIQTYYETY
jgi:hypothetical protein